MDFCYVWLRRLAASADPALASLSTRNVDELTGNVSMERGLDHFTEGLAAVFRNMAQALKPGRPLAFTYHHNRLEAYRPVAVAILDAGLACTATLPCPAEMGASIHISGTCSSIVDTVFVCRSTGSVSRRSLAGTTEEFSRMVADDLDQLRAGGVTLTRGDLRCIIFGHLVRMAVWNMRRCWDAAAPVNRKLATVERYLSTLPRPEEIEAALSEEELPVLRYAVGEDVNPYDGTEEISF
jgi:hypothetical protein